MKLSDLVLPQHSSALPFRTTAIAADEPQVVRQEMMKKVGGATGANGQDGQGAKAISNAAAALAALTHHLRSCSHLRRTIPGRLRHLALKTEAGAGDLDRQGGPRRQSWPSSRKMRMRPVAAAPAGFSMRLKAVFGPLTQKLRRLP